MRGLSNEYFFNVDLDLKFFLCFQRMQLKQDLLLPFVDRLVIALTGKGGGCHIGPSAANL